MCNFSLIVIVCHVFCIVESQVFWIFEGCAVAFLCELVVIKCIIVLIRIIVVVLNLWCIVVVLLIWVEQILAVHLVLIQESHANLLLLWLLLGEDSLYPCTLGTMSTS